MIRLLCVHRLHYRFGGAEAVHLDHLALFKERGWTCAEFALQHPKNEPSDYADYFPPAFEPGQASGLFGKLKAAARFLHAPEVTSRFAKLCDDFKPDVIQVHGLYYQLTTGILDVAKDRNIPVVCTLHDYKPLCPAYHMFRPQVGVCEDCKGGHQYRAFTNRCLHGSRAVSGLYALEGMLQWHTGALRKGVTHFVGPSRFLVDKFVEHGFPAAQLSYVPNFFETTDDTAVDPQKVAALKAQFGDYVLFFGRLSIEKGVSNLIAACHQAGLRLVLVGQGPQEAELRAQAAHLNADVVFQGHRTGADLWAHVEAARVVTLPSIWYENAPKSVLEAQARSKLVLVTQAGGMPEMIRDGETGFVVPMNDVVGLAQGLQKALTLDLQSAERIGKNAQSFVAATFTRDRYYQGFTDIYRNIVAK